MTPPPSKQKQDIQKGKDRLIKNLHIIDSLYEVDKLEEWKANIHMSAAPDKVKHFLLEACDLQLAKMANREALMVVHGDIDDFN